MDFVYLGKQFTAEGDMKKEFGSRIGMSQDSYNRFRNTFKNCIGKEDQLMEEYSITNV